jgi:hypothetical protein
VMSVKEFPTCNYVVMVASLNLCNHAAFKARVRTVSFTCILGVYCRLQ